MKKIILIGSVFVAIGVFARKPNYNEKAVAPYELEDPLVFVDGRKVVEPSQWPERRREILDIFAKEMYGQPPPGPEAVVTELIEEGSTLSGLAIRRQYRMWFKKDKTGPFVDWLMVLPNHINGSAPRKKGGRIICENKSPCPVVLMLNYRGNHAVLNDPEVAMPEDAWFRASASKDKSHKPQEINRAFKRDSRSRTTVPVDLIISRGYAYMTACYAQISPDVEVQRGDKESLAYTRIFDLWPKREEGQKDATTSLGAWAWVLSRGLDFAETLPEIDSKRCIVAGSSRLAKAALLAAARDERFAVCVANQTGGGGCPLAKRNYGENIGTQVVMFPHWFCKAYSEYADNESALKFDQHLLLASIAPRSLLVEGFNQGWFDTKGEYLACRAASPVWEFLGRGGMPKGEFPQNYDTSLIGTNLGYVRRGGAHGLSTYDWLWLLDFADRSLKRNSALTGKAK